MKDFFKFIKSNQTNVSLTVGIVVMLLIIAGGLIWNYQRWSVTSPSRISATSTEVASEETQQTETNSANQDEQSDQTGQNIQNPSSTATLDYEVKKGDSLWKIAERELGSGYKWKEINDNNKQSIGNNPGLLAIGQKLKINKQTNQVELIDTKYTVIKGDNLWNIAVKLCGDGFSYTQIAIDNKISTPSLIRPGQELMIKCAKKIFKSSSSPISTTYQINKMFSLFS